MAFKLPIVLTSGLLEQLQSGDRLLAGSGQAAWVEELTNDNAGDLVIGTPVYSSSDGGVDKALASTPGGTGSVVGLVYDASIASSAAGNILTHGVLEASTAQWDAVTGVSGGLVAGTDYYLSSKTAGALTTSRTNDLTLNLILVGVALSTTKLHVLIDSVPKRLVLSSDETIYVRTTGNDSTGDGSSGAPYLTVLRAIEHSLTIIPVNSNVIIDIGVGIFTQSVSIKVAHQNGGRVRLNGKFETLTSPTISNIDASATAGSSPYTSLEFVDFDLDVSAASDVAVGHFVRLINCTGGTNPQGLNGLHRIESLASGTATCRVWRKLNTTELPSGSITVASVVVIESVVSFTADDDGIDIDGPLDAGHWDAVVIQGSDSAVSGNRAGLRLNNGAGVRAASESGLTTGMFFHQWRDGVVVNGGSSAFIQRGGISKITSTGIFCQFGSVELLRFSSTINGTNGAAARASLDSAMLIDTAQIHSCGGASGFVISDGRSYVDARGATLHYDQGSGFGLVADNGGYIDAEGTTVHSSIATPYFPDKDTFGRGASYIKTVDAFDYQPAYVVAGYGAGTNYTLTNTPTEVTRGTTSSAITIAESGVVIIRAGVVLLYNSATFASGRTITLKLRRTNNTAADLTNGTLAMRAFVLTTFEGGIQVELPEVSYSTSNTNDRIAIFADVSAGPSAGSLEVSADWIVAEKVEDP